MLVFPSFADIDTRSSTFRCIHPCKGEVYQRCTRIVNKEDRLAAAKIKERIVLCKPSQRDLRQSLNEYAELCCCKASHRTTAKKLCRFDELACKWLAELAASHLVVLMEPIIAATPPRFLPYIQKRPNDDLEHALTSPLREKEFAHGTLYIVERREDPGFYKIGLTRQSADVRFAFFQSECGFEPVPLRQIRRVACIERVERLVHTELTRYRRENTTCGNRLGCQTLHTEWFEGDTDRAIDVMENWARWMTDTDPYEVDGRLKTYWFEILREVRERQLSLTCRNLMEVSEARLAQETLLTEMFRGLRIGRKLLS